MPCATRPCSTGAAGSTSVGAAGATATSAAAGLMVVMGVLPNAGTVPLMLAAERDRRAQTVDK